MRFMIDTETTGLDPQKDDVIQIGLVEMRWDGNFWKIGETIKEFLLYTDREPADDFAKKFMGPLYERCRRRGVSYKPEELRDRILQVFKKRGIYHLAGKNLGNFDLRFLEAKGYLLEGDYHYRLYDLTGAMALVSDVLNLEENDDRLRGLTLEAYARDVVAAPLQEEHKAHDAISDSIAQIQTLNGLIEMLRKAISSK